MASHKNTPTRWESFFFDILPTMSFSIIAAVDNNLLIGSKNDLPWGRIKADMKHFRDITTGHTVVMGQRTFESIGKPLPNRRNIVLSYDKSLQISGCEIVHSIEEAQMITKNDNEVFVIGGGSIYKAFMPFADRLYITFIEGVFSGDTYFPNIDIDVWRKISETIVKPNDETPYKLRFTIFERK